jgi:hypothetical protein
MYTYERDGMKLAISLLVVQCSVWGLGRWPSNDVILISTQKDLQLVSPTQPTVFADEFVDNYRLGDDGHCCQLV